MIVGRWPSAIARLAFLLPVAVSVFLAVLIGASGAGRFVEEPLSLARAIIRDHPASGRIHIIEIDAKSIAARGAWPWKRGVYAELITKLKASGVSTIAFDVDFSAPSTPAEDQAFARGLAQFGGAVILPTFVQRAGSKSLNFIENLPIAVLRNHAFLGAVNVSPDRDGRVRRFTYGITTDNLARPSIPALLAQSPGAVNDDFRIDVSISPATIPMHSVEDVIKGNVRPDILVGKTVIIGATAIELGDRYAVPRHGVIPGVIIQVLAAETLLQGTQNDDLGYLPMLALAIIVVGLIASRRMKIGSQATVWTASLFILLNSLVFEMLQLGSLQVVPAIVLLAAYSLSISLLRGARKLRTAAFVDGETGLPNVRSLVQAHENDDCHVVVAVRIKQFSELTAILDENQRALLIARIAERLALTFSRNSIFSVSPGLLGIVVPKQSVDVLIDQIEGLIGIFRSSIDVGGRTLLVNLAFGLADGVGKNVSKSLGLSTFAAARADEDGHHWTVHSDQVTDMVDLGQVLLADIDGALERGDIYVVFQPKWDFVQSRISGAEALVRWRHRELGPIGPDRFIPVLEQNGRLEQLTLHVFDQSLVELRRWTSANLDLTVAINISAPLFADCAFVSLLLDRLNQCGAMVSQITLEITESATIASPEQTVSALKAVRELGAKISIDDYGTGQSTLSYLKTFPADEIKIDQSFVTRMLASNSDQILVRSTIELAHQLGFKVVAEGIEEAACFDRLAEYGCDTGQGWHIGKPATNQDFFDEAIKHSVGNRATLSKLAPRA